MVLQFCGVQSDIRSGAQQVTSLFLHWFPACVAWTERWHPQVQRWCLSEHVAANPFPERRAVRGDAEPGAEGVKLNSSEHLDCHHPGVEQQLCHQQR